MPASPRNKEVGERIRAGYIKAGYNRNQFSRLLDVNYTTVINWEKGNKMPSGENLQAIAEAINMPVGWLLTGDEQGVSPSPQPGYEKAAEQAWTEFMQSDPALVKLLTPEDLEEIKGIRFRSGAPGGAAFYRYIAMAKLEHRAGKDIAEALDADDITPEDDGDLSLKILPNAKKGAR